ncbi:hypothetical protein LINPERHAP2_LOCUS36908 [Linum perenne]
MCTTCKISRKNGPDNDGLVAVFFFFKIRATFTGRFTEKVVCLQKRLEPSTTCING